VGFLLSFLARRLAQGLFIVLLVSFGIFTILRLVPGDPVRMILGPMANAAAIDDAAKSLGLRDPIPILAYTRGSRRPGHFLQQGKGRPIIRARRPAE
jgi:ABC-type dipeptide/oligopeptide/nickel transport system permease component